MQDTIKSLWNGDYTPAFETVDYGEEVSKMFDTAEQLEIELSNTLNEEMQKMLEKYIKAKALLHARELESAFAKGFSIGMKLALESFAKNQ